MKQKTAEEIAKKLAQKWGRLRYSRLARKSPVFAR
jgi:hypothetical protein